MVKMPPYGGGCESQQVAKLGGADRAVFQHGREYPVPGAFISVSHRTGGCRATVLGGR